VKGTKRLMLGVGAWLCIAGAQAEDLARGQAIYQTRCIGCHTTSVHDRESRKAKDFDELRAAVVRFAGEVGGVWQPDEIDDVAAFLNQSYYRYPCPPAICRTAKRAALDR